MLIELVLVAVLSECPEGTVHQMPYCVPIVQVVESEPFAGYVGSGVERWRPWVEIYFRPADVPRAMRIMACESSGNPNALGPYKEVGLFQHHPRYWAERSASYGWGGWSAYSVDANVAVAAALAYDTSGGGWQHWVCK